SPSPSPTAGQAKEHNNNENASYTLNETDPIVPLNRFMRLQLSAAGYGWQGGAGKGVPAEGPPVRSSSRDKEGCGRP
ncbi:hypothetical protein, partial [Bifidobacterium longum]|uniref:hypothetical protein n=1 Tax=Bifidobacterium longum TaxID=216816 RepID=UPI002024FFCC